MVPDLKLPIGSRCIKYLMFIFNLFFVITGIILLSIGATTHAVYSGYLDFLELRFLSVPSLLIAVGSIIFIVAFFGCCGAIRENYCMVLTFTSLMIVIFILELAAAIAGYVLRDDARDLMKAKMNATMENYTKDSGITHFWDDVQMKFDCCGAEGPEDWVNLNNKTGTSTNNTVPLTCCKSFVGTWGTAHCSLDEKNSTLRNTGCLTAFGRSIRERAVELGEAGLGVAFVQFVGIWFSIYLTRAIKMNYQTM